MYKRLLQKTIEKKIGKGKAIIITGPRQSGKTTLIATILKNKQHLLLDCDDPKVRKLLDNPNTEEIKNLIGNKKYVFIDEAQRVDGIGITLKIITDQFKKVQLFVSGSSSFELSGKINEPLTGRKFEYELFPVCWEEYEKHNSYLKSIQQLNNRLIYGFYPDVLNNQGNEAEILKNLVSSYLFKDIFAISDIRKPETLEKLVQALAFQIGSEINYNEIAQVVGIDKNTVSKYVDILQKRYIVFKISSFSRNLRNELKQSKKIYFYDNGVRNMIIGNFNHVDLRNDKGALWENFLMSERLKHNCYKQSLSKMYFWRSFQQQEVDLVEENQGKITGYEFKWKQNKNQKLPKTFTEAYNADSMIVDTNNFRQFVKS